MQFARHFRDLGVSVVIHPTIGIAFDERWGVIPDDVKALTCFNPEPHDLELIVSAPTFKATHPNTVYFTMHESTQLNLNQVDNLSLARSLVVPSSWNLHHFKTQLPRQLIDRVPLGIDPLVYYPRPLPEGPLVFGAAGRYTSAGKRKNPRLIFDAFSQAFPDDPDVRLRFKCYPDCVIPRSTDSRVEIIRSHFSDAEFVQFLTSLHVLVAPTSGEGWGLVIQQAAALGRPAIVSSEGGHRQYLTDQGMFELAGNYSVFDSNYYHGSMFKPCRLSLVMLLKYVRNNPASIKLRGASASRCAALFPLQQTNDKLTEVLKSRGGLIVP